MELTAFNSRLGLSQGRIKDHDGDHVFVLGDNSPGYYYRLESGDRVEIVQETKLDDIDLIRTQMSLWVPEDLPANLGWEASIIVDGVPRAHATCPPGRKRDITDLAANVSKLAGSQQVGVRLQLIGI